MPEGYPDHAELGNGSVIKNTDYRDRIEDAVKHISGHPLHHGVTMQAHHLISGYAMDKLPEQTRRNMEYFNYDINHLKNLVLLPSTLPGACHLGVQPHRGNHTTPLPGAKKVLPEDDAKIVRTYHTEVKRKLSDLAPLIKKTCVGECTKKQLMNLAENVNKKLNAVSQEILELIQSVPSEAPLTKLFAYFQPGDQVGCAGVVNVNDHGDKPEMHGKHQCPVHRNHYQPQQPGKANGKITYKSNGRYQLEVGK